MRIKLAARVATIALIISTSSATAATPRHARRVFAPFVPHDILVTPPFGHDDVVVRAPQQSQEHKVTIISEEADSMTLRLCQEWIRTSPERFDAQMNGLAAAHTAKNLPATEQLINQMADDIRYTQTCTRMIDDHNETPQIPRLIP